MVSKIHGYKTYGKFIGDWTKEILIGGIKFISDMRKTCEENEVLNFEIDNEIIATKHVRNSSG